jgi:hypothetical protein
MAAAEFRQQHSNGIDWGERYGLSRHMVYLQSVGNFDPADLVYRQQLGLTVPSFADPTAAELANSRTRDQLEQAVLEPVLLGAIAYGGLGSARTLLGGPAPLPTSTVMTRNVIDERVFIGSVRMSPVQRSIVNNLTGAGDAIIVGTNNPAARLPQDLAVSPVPPNAINTAGRRVGLNANQNAQVQADAATLRQLGATDIRIDQQQISNGCRVGICRPDLQATMSDGLQVYIEYDTSSSLRGPGHATRLLANDPNAIVILRTLD